ncbi:hypothetical protein Gohar_006901 [Gossypium harknessii]|uniref:Uncharacterized protein n=1 Tax=Gossypium harknessii TaxID=34285 RepID=A0A7J9GEW8_9ROSI|nr:hypothetical protein [Gossypium harknessii]
MSWRHSKWHVEYHFNRTILVLGNFT